jgi:hypothetical protein
MLSGKALGLKPDEVNSSPIDQARQLQAELRAVARSEIDVTDPVRCLKQCQHRPNERGRNPRSFCGGVGSDASGSIRVATTNLGQFPPSCLFDAGRRQTAGIVLGKPPSYIPASAA